LHGNIIDLNFDPRGRAGYHSSRIILGMAKMQFKTRRGLPRSAKLSGDFDASWRIYADLNATRAPAIVTQDPPGVAVVEESRVSALMMINLPIGRVLRRQPLARTREAKASPARTAINISFLEPSITSCPLVNREYCILQVTLNCRPT